MDYGDETFRHNMSLFRHRLHMVTKWWRNNIRHLSFVTECIGDENVLSPNIFVTKPYFQWRNISSPNVFFFFFPNFNRLGDKILSHQLFFYLLLFIYYYYYYYNFNRSSDELFCHQFLLIVKYGDKNYHHQFFFFY